MMKKIYDIKWNKYGKFKKRISYIVDETLICYIIFVSVVVMMENI